MEDTQKNLSPIAPMTDVDLDQVSGGNVLLDYQQGAAIMSSLSNNVSALLAPFADDLNSLEGKLRCRNIYNTLGTYDKSSASMTAKCNHLATSYNKYHKGQTQMTPELASFILPLDPGDRAAIMALDDVDKMIPILDKIYTGK